jgi:hypothetical protein
MPMTTDFIPCLLISMPDPLISDQKGPSALF